MEHADYVYTTGMDDDEVEERLQTSDHGVLALADGDDAYAVPLNYHYDGEQFLLRVSDHDDAEKRQYLETTDTATFVCYDTTDDESWSIHVRGPVRRSDRDIDEATLNEWFPPFHLFDEAVEDVEFLLYELELAAVTGRKTAE
ncbi:pyridoxamine 5'-phosphate oxidase family protein [Natrinema sp. 1APR25-10V2]|uniref:pyridoxamine 5'-phosphate oxidase family protein n=1 Tax=Natrinema sp. 1APR25-10V2 TaxID=2951081 RepID=UPI002874A9CE|nr:pyridoxamine 5'-phosphate oxidase family protein [Natrinema sp. 1APR25-10V2]MDS0477698.1 pyridoxamine 5'-phosphate oxidase family protein [Natrinema sp. 1APR25-10V2]